jgi:ubiquinone biosynthesis accessory factor UbiJ
MPVSTAQRAGDSRAGAYNPGMLEAIKALAERSVLERLVLLVNHVIAAEPAALERLRPHAARTMQIELTGWPTLLPAIGPFAFRVSPAGLVEWLPEASSLPPDLRVAVDAANPALALTRIVAGERPAITVSGDAAFASDIDWLIDNLRWDLQDDLARFVGDGPARQLAKVGGWFAGALREGAKALRDLAARAPGPTAAPPR